MLREHRLGPHDAALQMIVFGVDDDPAFAQRARRAGADAWIVKDRADEMLPGLLSRRPRPLAPALALLNSAAAPAPAP